MSLARMAGTALAVGGLGAGGAIAADALAHDPMDRIAQQYKDFRGAYQGADELAQKVYVGVFGQGETSLKDRIMAAGILSGELPPGAAEEAKKMADTPAGKKGIDLAAKVMMNRPELGPPAAKLAEREISLTAQTKTSGLTSEQVTQAADQGAGVSPLPAMLGGAGVGSGAAIVASLLNRRAAAGA